MCLMNRSFLRSSSKCFVWLTLSSFLSTSSWSFFLSRLVWRYLMRAPLLGNTLPSLSLYLYLGEEVVEGDDEE